MEQLMNWDPDVIITAGEKVYGLIHRAPSLPYNWVGRPPSVNRILVLKDNP